MHNNYDNNFREYITNHNNAVAFASFGANVAPIQDKRPYSLQIHGQIYHRTRSLHHGDHAQPIYSQLYKLEGNQAIESRMAHSQNSNCLTETMQLITNTINLVSPYAAALQTHGESGGRASTNCGSQ